MIQQKRMWISWHVHECQPSLMALEGKEEEQKLVLMFLMSSPSSSQIENHSKPLRIREGRVDNGTKKGRNINQVYPMRSISYSDTILRAIRGSCF